MQCEVCGAEMQLEECGPCHGTGEDLDMNNGAGGVCEVCDGGGEVAVCPNAADDAHEAAWKREVFGL